MQLKTMFAIQSAAEQLDLDVQSRESYSGRGMYGKTTSAIVADHLGSVFAAFAFAGNLASADDGTLDEMVEDLKGLRIDQMGLGVIVY